VTAQVVSTLSGVRRGRHRTRRHLLSRPLLFLHGRARHLGWLIVGVSGVALGGWWAAHTLAHGDFGVDPERRVPVAVAAPLLAAVLASVGLGGADEELERTTAWRWRTVRTLHVIAVAVAAAVVLTLIGRWEPQRYGVDVIVRNVIGCFGIVALSAVVLRARLAWAPLFGYVTTIYLAAPKPPTNATAWWTWPIQPSSSSMAWWAVGTVYVLGTVLYAFVGARRAGTRDEI
jgi:hypothetical protein